MATAADLRLLALALPGTLERSHHNRTAYKVDRMYVTISEDAMSANFKFTSSEQEFKCQLSPDIFQPVENGWGRMGWTTCDLAAAAEADLQAALLVAYEHACGKSKPSL